MNLFESGPNSPGVRGASNLRKAPKVHGQTHSWLAQAAESLHFLEKSRNNGHKDVSQSRSAPLDLQNNLSHSTVQRSLSQEPSDRAVKMRTSVYIPNMSGNSLASHQQERVKRRRSLTKTSMHELGVDDLRPWAQPPPKSPVPHKSPSTDGTMDPFLALALKNNASAAKKSPSPEPRKSPVQKVSAPTGPSKAPKVSLDCPDRPTMRALLDDLDNITIQAHQEIDKFKLEDQRNKALREPNPITIQVPTVKSNFIPSSIQQQSESSQKLQKRSTPAPTSSPTPVSSSSSVEKLAKRTTSPELKRTSPPSQSAQSAISAPKIIRSSVGTSRTSSSNVKQEKSSLISGSSRLSQLKNKLQNKIKQQETQHTTPDISKTPVTQPKEVPARKSPEPPPEKSSLPKEKTSVDIKTKFEQEEHKAKEPEPSPKKVEFTKDLGTVENSAQSVKAWQESPERKTVNIMAQMMKKVAEDEETKIKPIGAAVTPVEPPKKRPQIVARKEKPKSNVEKDLNRLLNPTFTAPEPVESSQKPVSPPVKTNDQIKQKKFPPVEKFHFPFGKPRPAGEMSGYLQAIDEYAKRNRKQEFFMKDMGPLVKEMKLPFYWKDPLFRACGGKPSGKVSIFQLGSTWKKICETRFDSESQLMALLTYGTSRNYLVPSDLTPLITDVIETHPGLEFLRSAPEFHTRYVTTVIARLFYIASAWSKKLYVPGLRKSEFAQVLNSLDSLDDINNEQRFFSYEHFYVIYCRFWELDSDHDLRIGPTDLSKYGDYSIAVKAIDRILSGTVTAKRRVMEYSEFVWFIMSEEDKSTATSSEYWFRVMDRDGDGAITIDDLEFFYAEQETRLRTLGVEPLPFLDLLCLMLDLVKPEQKHLITLRDLKKCRLQHIFFDTFLNAEKYLDREQREPFDGNQEWNWARWATEEYSLLVADEDD